MLLSPLLQQGIPCNLRLNRSNLHSQRRSLFTQSNRSSLCNRNSLNLRSQFRNLHLRLLNPCSLLYRSLHNPHHSLRSLCLSLHSLRRSLNNQAGDMFRHSRSTLLALVQV